MKNEKKIFWKTILSVLFLAFLIVGCKDEDDSILGLCPEVVSTNPENGDSNVPLNQVITATFNEAMNPSSMGAGSISVSESDPIGGSATVDNIPGIISYDEASFTMSFDPTNPLNNDRTYTVTIYPTVKDIMGNLLQAPYIWAFSTGNWSIPIVISTDPADLEINVPVTEIITATFSVPMDALTITDASFTLYNGTTQITGVVTYLGSTATFTPDVDLLLGNTYEATLTTAIKTPLGIPLTINYVWSFSTGNIPTVISVIPLDLASNVPLNQVISATFSEPMDALTITDVSFTLFTGTTQVTGIVGYSGSTATFTPDSNLISGNTYEATITTAAKNPLGVSLANDYVWTFNVGTTTNPPLVDINSLTEYGIIAGVGVSNNAGPSEIHDMNVGIYPGVRSSITGFFDVDGGPGLIFNGAFHAADDLVPVDINAALNQAKLDLVQAYDEAAGATIPAPAVAPADLGGKTLAPGIYTSASTMLLQNGDLTLDAQGNADAVWIFQVGSGFTSVGGAGGNVILAGGAKAKNVFWQVSSSAIIGDGTIFKGNVLAFSSITMNSGAVAEGRMLARNGSVVLTNSNIITRPTN
ncbi:Ig-like domain-containing protein [Yeosuana sp. AK3]